MTLRLRLLLGYGYLVALVLLATATALVGFLQLSTGIDVVLQENFESIRASIEMIKALERQDSATLSAPLEGRIAEEMRGYERAFREALAEAERNITEEEERPVLRAIRDRFDRYAATRDRFLESSATQGLERYERDVFPHFIEVESQVLRLLEINQEAMMEAEREAQQAALQYGTLLGFLVVFALVSLVFVSRTLHGRVLARLATLRRGMAAIAGGDLQRRLQAQGDVELTLIAEEVNRLLDQQQELRGRMQSRITRERQLVLGLLASHGEDVALYDLGGELLAGGLEEGTEEVVQWITEQDLSELTSGNGSPTVAEASRSNGETEPSAHLPGGARITLLLAPGKRPVGWLAKGKRTLSPASPSP